MNKMINALNAACQRVSVVEGQFRHTFDRKPVWANMGRIWCQTSSVRTFFFLEPEYILAYI